MSTLFTVEHNLDVTLDSLHQWRTYGGLLEGLPTDKMNANILKRVEEEARKHTYASAVYIIKPEQIPIPYDRVYSFGTPMEMPPITCVASFTSHKPARNQQMDGSRLTIVWYQEEYAFPVKQSVIEQFIEIPWSKVAEDFEY